MFNLSFGHFESVKLTLISMIVNRENGGAFFEMLPIHIGVLRIWDDDAGSRNKLDRVSYYVIYLTLDKPCSYSKCIDKARR